MPRPRKDDPELANPPVEARGLNRLRLLTGGGATVGALVAGRLLQDPPAAAAARSGAPELLVQDYGARGNGLADDTAAIQRAIDDAQSAVSGDSGAPIVYFPPGVYVVRDTIVWKSAHLVGAFPNNSVRLVWNGPANGTMVAKWPTRHAGGGSFALIRGINFRRGTATPSTFVDVTTLGDSIDKFGLIECCHFNGCSGDAIKALGWINAHWTDLRFDEIGGYAIRLTAYPTQSGSSFVLDRFTYDHSLSSGPGSGVVLVDASRTGDQGIGTVHLANGRIEVNKPWSGPRGVVVVKPGKGARRSIDVHLSDLTYMNGCRMGGDSLLHRASGDEHGSETLQLTNVSTTGLASVLGGTWPAGTPYLPSGTYGSLTFNHNAPNNVADMLDLRSFSGGRALLVRQGRDRHPRLSVGADGAVHFGDGAQHEDVRLSRGSRGALETDGQFVALGAVTTKTVSGRPTDSDVPDAKDGTLVLDQRRGRLYVRVRGHWRSVRLT